MMSYLYGCQLGSVSVVADGSGDLVGKTIYHPCSATYHQTDSNPTDYGYTGQMKEGDIYYYGARWQKVPETQWSGIDPAIGRFLQADTIVPMATQGTQAFDRYAYVNNCPSVNSGITPAWASVIVTSASKIHLLNAVGSLRSQIHAIWFRVEQFYKLWMIVRSKLKKVSPAAVHARRVSAGPSEPLLE